MDIERINDHTIKLFITYRDIEDRGYSREEIWYNRSKGEELFWDVMNEVNTEDYFDLEGPIWIHINASEQGLEVIVTRAANGADTESVLNHFEESQEIASQLNEMEATLLETMENDEKEDSTSLVHARYKFKDIDELIPVAKRLIQYNLAASLYKMDNDYYVCVDLSSLEDVYDRRNVLSILKEFLQPTKLTIHRIEEYGQAIMLEDCFEKVLHYFS